MSAQDVPTSRVIICRHGETEWAKSGRFTGCTEIELTPAGIAQVSSASARLVGAGKLLDPARLVRIFVSPRVRARQTLDLLLPLSTDVAAERITLSEDITEWDYGDYEGLKEDEIRSLRRQRGLDVAAEWNIWSDGCEGGESMQQVTERLDRLISQIRQIQESHIGEQKPSDIVIVAHGLILRCFVKRWIGLSINHPLELVLDTGAIAVLSYKGDNVNKPALHVGIALPYEDYAT